MLTPKQKNVNDYFFHFLLDFFLCMFYNRDRKILKPQKDHYLSEGSEAEGGHMARIPAYRQMYNSLKKDIREGRYAPGSFLPTESEMEELYGVSRTTVRRAIGMLTNEGYLSVTQGRGTEVQEISTSQHLNKITSFTETLRRKGYQVSTQGLAQEKVPAPDYIRDALALREGEQVYHIQRVQCADGKPVCVMEDYVAANQAPGFHIQESGCVSVYACLEEEYGLFLKDAVEHISAVSASFTQSQILRIPVGAPLLHSRRIANTEHGALIYSSLYVVAERYEYQIYQAGRG